ncbi:MAG: Ig-like domain-containing protein [Planctomycetota bacterium]
MRSTWLIALAVLVIASGCTEESKTPRGAEGADAARDLSVVAFEQRSRPDVRRDEPLILSFSDALDAESVRQGGVRVIRRRGNREQPFTAQVDGRRLILTPPGPFGFEAGERYWVIVEGFPSLRAPRSRDGRRMRRRYRASFGTSRLYRPETTPPSVTDVSLREEMGGGWRVHLLFSEAIEPGTIDPGITVTIVDLSDGRPIEGRVLADRNSRLFRFLPPPGVRPAAVLVRLTRGIQDLAGNPLRLPGTGEWILELPPVPEPPVADDGGEFGEIAEDFTSDRMMDPAGTCALWNDPSRPGVLLGSPARTTQFLPGDGAQPDEWVGIGDEPVEIRIVLTREELGPARELTGLLWSPPESGRTRATYRGVTVRIARTNAERLRDVDEAVVPVTVLSEAEYRVDPGREDLVPIPFERPWRYDGTTNLLITIRIGAGDHTNFLRVRRAGSGEATVRIGRRVEALRPVLAVRGFSLAPMATSWFYDTGSDSPEYLPVFLHPERMPRGVTMELSFQGATMLGPAGLPPTGEPGVVSGWVDDVTRLGGFRYLRFRVVFTGGSLTGEEPVLDDIVVPFRR